MKKRDKKILDKQLSLTENLLSKIENSKGGSKTLKYIVDNNNALSKVGLSGDNLVKVAAHGGGSKTLKYIVDNKNMINFLEQSNELYIHIRNKKVKWIRVLELISKKDLSVCEEEEHSYIIARKENTWDYNLTECFFQEGDHSLLGDIVENHQAVNPEDVLS